MSRWGMARYDSSTTRSIPSPQGDRSGVYTGETVTTDRGARAPTGFGVRWGHVPGRKWLPKEASISAMGKLRPRQRTGVTATASYTRTPSSPLQEVVRDQWRAATNVGSARAYHFRYDILFCDTIRTKVTYFRNTGPLDPTYSDGVIASAVLQPNSIQPYVSF